jgi:hypothetical protein
LGQRGAIAGVAGSGLFLLDNSYVNATPADAAIATGAASRIDLAGGQIDLKTAPSVAAGATQTFTTRATIAPTGTLTLTPDAGQDALYVNGTIGGAGHIQMKPGGGAGYGVIPATDNSTPSGNTAQRWSVVCAVQGTINTSSRDLKEDITPLDPAAAMAAVRATEPVVFDYKPPVRPPTFYRRDGRQKVDVKRERDRLRYGPLEAAARHQAGFIAETAAPLFLTGEGQTNPGNTAGVLLAALRDLDTRLAALEGTP